MLLKLCIRMVKRKKRRGDKTIIIKFWRRGHEIKIIEAIHTLHIVH